MTNTTETAVTEVAVIESELLNQAVANQTEIGAQLLQQLSEGFAPYFKEAESLLQTAGSIKVDNEQDVTQMAKARETRIALVKVRTGANKKREELKADALRYGNAVQGMFNILKMAIEPTEERLEQEERYAEIKKTERQLNLRIDRMEELSPYAMFAPTGIDLGLLEDEQYQKILTGARLQYEADVKAKREAEAKRIEEENKAEQIRKEQEAKRKQEEEARKKELEEAKLKAREAELKAQAEAKARQAEKAQAEKEKKEAEARAKEAEAKAREAEVEKAKAIKDAEISQRREQEAKQSAEVQVKQLEAQNKALLETATQREQTKITQSVEYMKSHGEMILNDSEKWENIMSNLRDQMKVKFTSETNKKLHARVVDLLTKVNNYIEDNKNQNKL